MTKVEAGTSSPESQTHAAEIVCGLLRAGVGVCQAVLLYDCLQRISAAVSVRPVFDGEEQRCSLEMRFRSGKVFSLVFEYGVLSVNDGQNILPVGSIKKITTRTAKWSTLFIYSAEGRRFDLTSSYPDGADLAHASIHELGRRGYQCIYITG